MNVFRLHRGYRKIGPSYGLPVFYIDMGIGLNLTPEELLVRLEKMELFLGATIVIRNNPIREKGAGILVEGLKSVNLKVEVEEDGTTRDPMWFPKVDRWVVDFIANNEFNYGVLRARQDLLLCRSGGRLDEFLSKTEKMGCLKGIVVNDEDGVWEKVKNYDVRVYRGENGDT